MTRKEYLQHLHRKSPRTLWEAAGSLAVFFGLLGVSVVAWEHGWWPVSVACWVVQGHVGHTNLLAFHETSHYTLHPDRRVNELQGLFVGSVILTPISAYRWVHNQHHLHLGTPRDAEQWPYVDPAAPRWFRRLTALCELALGFIATPVLFLRGVLVAETMPRATKRRLVGEYALVVVTWAAVLGGVAWFGLWEPFLVGYLVPTWLAGNLQSWRKFTEHMGLLGHDVPTTTRTVVDETPVGRLLSATMLHIDYHGPHHEYAKIPHFNLPAATPVVFAEELKDPAGANVFRSYPAAVWDMVKTLGDPRVGSQWVNGGTGFQACADRSTGLEACATGHGIRRPPVGPPQTA
jgi:fatty acid desaturase